MISQLLFKHFDQLFDLTSLLLGEIIFLVLSVCRKQVYFFVHFEVDVYYPYSAAFPPMFKGESRLPDSARSLHDIAGFGVRKQLYLQPQQVLFVETQSFPSRLKYRQLYKRALHLRSSFVLYIHYTLLNRVCQPFMPKNSQRSPLRPLLPPHTMSIASPKEKKRYFSATAVL